MRYAVLSDIHANLPALRSALEVLQRHGVDAYLCLGDLVGYGPFPNECIEVVAQLETTCVAGNHDQIALGMLSDERCIPLARNSLRWTRTTLTQASRRYLEALPVRSRVETLCLAHGSLEDPQEYVTRPEQMAVQLNQLADLEPDAGVLLLGHTHRPAYYVGDDAHRPETATLSISAERTLLNPGSVGQSREGRPLARFLVLDTGRRQVTFHAVPYDVHECRAALRRNGLPPHSCDLAPSLLRRCAGKMKRLARRILNTEKPQEVR